MVVCLGTSILAGAVPQPPAVTVQTVAPPATLTTAAAASITSPAFYQAWKFPDNNGRGVVECTLATADIPNLTIFILGDGALNFNNIISVTLGGATADKAATMAVGTGVAPGTVGTGWAFPSPSPVIAAATDVRVSVNQDIKLITVDTKPQGAPDIYYETVLVYSDYNKVGTVSPTAFAGLNGKPTYVGFGTVGSVSTITNVRMSSWEAQQPDGFTQKIAGTDLLEFGTGPTGSVAYSISVDKKTITSMNLANAVSDDIMKLLSTWQPLALNGASVAAARIESFSINGANQCFIALTDGTIYKAPTIAGTFTSLAYAKGAMAAGPIVVESGKADAVFVLDQANALWRLAGTPLAALREGPQQPVGTYLPITDISQGADGTTCAVDASGALWVSTMAAASDAKPLTWTRFPVSVAMVGAVSQPLVFESVCVVGAKNIAATTTQQQVVLYDGTKWTLVPAHDGPAPACGFVSVVLDAAGNSALFDANGNLYTNFPPMLALPAPSAVSKGGIDMTRSVTGPTAKQKAVAKAYAKYVRDYAQWNKAAPAKKAAALVVLNKTLSALKAACGNSAMTDKAAIDEGVAAKAAVDGLEKQKKDKKSVVDSNQKKTPSQQSRKTSKKKKDDKKTTSGAKK